MQTYLATDNLQLTTLRAWTYLIWLSFQRQARAHLMVWIALGLLGLTALIVGMNTQAGRWSMAHWTWPRGGLRVSEHLWNARRAAALPWSGEEAALMQMHEALFGAAVQHASGFFVFSNWIVFFVFCNFLLPLWSLSFATEGLGREREAHNLLWVLTRPLSRPAIYFAKLLA